MLPIDLRTVTATARLPDTKSEALHLTAEFDSHKLTSQEVNPIEVDPVYVFVAKPSPTKVTLADPVDGVFIQ